MAIVVIDRTDTAMASLLVFLAGYAAANTAAFAVIIHLRGRTAIAHYLTDGSPASRTPASTITATRSSSTELGPSIGSPRDGSSTGQKTEVLGWGIWSWTRSRAGR